MTRALLALGLLGASALLGDVTPRARAEGAARVLVGAAGPVTRYALDNGLEVLLQEDHQVPLVTVSVGYHVGSADDPEGLSGLAHLCEHLMFRGSKHLSESPQGVLSDAGALHHNGATTFHETSYFETVPRVNLQTALWLESDRMGFLLDALDEEKLRNEREVVKNERRQLFDAAPYGLAEERLWQALFPRPHPYGGLVIGSLADLDRATLSDVRAFFQRHYMPSNATLALVGDFDPQAARQLVQRYFGTLPRRPRAAPREVPPALLDREVILQHAERVGTAPKVLLAWHSPAEYQPGDAAAAVLAAVLSASRASRLPRRLMGPAGLASSVVAQQDSLRAQSVFRISAVARPGADPRALVREIDAVLDEIRQGGVTDEEIGRAQMRLRTRSVIEMQEAGQRARRLQSLDAEAREAREDAWPVAGLGRYGQVGRDDVVRLVRGVLSPGRRVVLYAVPAGAR